MGNFHSRIVTWPIKAVLMCVCGGGRFAIGSRYRCIQDFTNWSVNQARAFLNDSRIGANVAGVGGTLCLPSIAPFRVSDLLENLRFGVIPTSPA